MEILRDPIWTGISAIFTIIMVLLYAVVERERVLKLTLFVNLKLLFDKKRSQSSDDFSWTMVAAHFFGGILLGLILFAMGFILYLDVPWLAINFKIGLGIVFFLFFSQGILILLLDLMVDLSRFPSNAIIKFIASSLPFYFFVKMTFKIYPKLTILFELPSLRL